MKTFDGRTTLSRSAARSVYDGFATTDHAGGKDVESGYGGPAITALLAMANLFSSDGEQRLQPPTSAVADRTTMRVLDYGCGQGKLAELVLDDYRAQLGSNKEDKRKPRKTTRRRIEWRGIDQSPKMVEAARNRLARFDDDADTRISIDLLESGDPSDAIRTVKRHSVDRFVSTYCLDLLSESDMYKVLDLAQHVLDPEDGMILLAGITWGYTDSIRTFLMTALWELLYVVARRKVGGCRPQNLVPYLKERGWRILDVQRTMPVGFPWMVRSSPPDRRYNKK